MIWVRDLPRILLVGQLKEIFGSEEMEVKGKKLSEVLKFLSIKVTDLLDLDGKPSGKYLFLINGVDSLVYGDDPEVGDEDNIAIVPISHGG